MKIKKYIGKDMPEIMLRVKNELGSDAIILSTKKVRQKGIFGIFKKPVLEVSAAVEDRIIKQPPRRTPPPEPPPPVPVLSKQIDSELENKVQNMEKMLSKIYEEMKISSEQSVVPSAENHLEKASKMIQMLSNNLLNNDVEKGVVEKIVEEVKKEIVGDSNINEIAMKMYQKILDILGEVSPIEISPEKGKNIVSFVGPTGVGKTTTIAKIAANFTLDNNKSIGIISTDTYRIAAVEQLRTYADILSIPVYVVYTPEDMAEGLRRFEDKDLILIDTAGRSHKDKAQFDELKKILEVSNPNEVYLLISCTLSSRVCREIIDSYSFLSDYKLLITKTDEAYSLGPILNVKDITNKKLSYITTGQSVPDDIMLADCDEIAKKLLGSR